MYMNIFRTAAGKEQVMTLLLCRLSFLQEIYACAFSSWVDVQARELRQVCSVKQVSAAEAEL